MIFDFKYNPETFVAEAINRTNGESVVKVELPRYLEVYKKHGGCPAQALFEKFMSKDQAYLYGGFFHNWLIFGTVNPNGIKRRCCP